MRPGLANPFFHLHEQVSTDTTVGRRTRVNQFLQLQLHRHVGRSGGRQGRQGSDRSIRHVGLGQSPGIRQQGVHRDLELAIADLIGAKTRSYIVGGHATNETTIGHLFGPGDLVLHDALAHNSIVQGPYSRAHGRRPFPHNDSARRGSAADRVARANIAAY